MRRNLAPALALCSMLAPVAAVASQASTGAAITSNLRVSTGVKAPAILGTAEIALPQNIAEDSLPVAPRLASHLPSTSMARPRTSGSSSLSAHPWTRAWWKRFGISVFAPVPSTTSPFPWT